MLTGCPAGLVTPPVISAGSYFRPGPGPGTGGGGGQNRQGSPTPSAPGVTGQSPLGRKTISEWVLGRRAGVIGGPAQAAS